MADHPHDLELYSPDPWERQVGEPDRAWRAFRIYRDLGPGTRSFSRVGKELGVTRQNVDRMAARHGWRERVEEYDREQDRIERAEVEAARREANVRHRDAASRLHHLGTTRIFGSEDGQVQAVKLAEVDFESALAAIKEGFRQERVALGIATDLLGRANSVPVREAQTIVDALVAIAFEMLPTEQHALYLERVRAVAAASERW